MGEWTTTELEEFIDIKNGYAFKSRDFIDSGVPVIKIKNVKPNRILLNDLSFVSADIANQMSEYVINRGDLLITMSGNRADGSPESWVGKVAKFDRDGQYLLNQRVSRLIVDETRADSSYISYLLSSWNYQRHFVAIANSSGGQANISPQLLKSLKISLPSLTEQREIASVLSSLDDKIDLLHRQNKTLEAMAQTLFRQWFVEEAEHGWETLALNDILSVKGGSTPSTRNEDYWNGEYSWTSPRDITNLEGIHLFDTSKKITKAGLDKISSGILPRGTLLMSSRAPVGALAFTEVELAINQGYIAILADKICSKEFIYLWLKSNNSSDTIKRQ